MMLTGPGGVVVRGRYASGVAGVSITRRRLDQWLVEQAVLAGAAFEDGVNVTGPLVSDGRVAGIRIADSQERESAMPATLTIAADGRRSRFAFALGLARHPARPRRWAIGAYFDGVADLSALGEMHVRRGHYIGVAPIGGGLANVCLVVPFGTADRAWRRPGAMLDAYLASDAWLAARCGSARRLGDPQVLGPMAVDVRTPGCAGLLLAGDASGFIDPMTGDGIRLALSSAELAATVAGDVLAGRVAADRAHRELARARRRHLAPKWRFNRTLRQVVSRPGSVTAAAGAARVFPRGFAALIRYAGDCGLVHDRAAAS
jgi:flavin-dependent dehydrogenase